MRPATQHVGLGSVAIYARTSTDRQEREETIKSQLEACERYCAENGVSSERRLIDDGVSGSDILRPSLTKLRELVWQGTVTTIIAYDVDRLSRNLTHLLILMEEFEKGGAEVRFVRSPREDSPEGRVLFNIKGVFAEYEREKIRERTLRGKTRYIKDGGWFGPPPYGYRVVNQHLEPDEQEARWLREVFSLYANGNFTLHGLADYLNEKGVPTRREHNKRQGWQPEIVRRILGRELYTGVFKREIRGIPESACEAPVPALIDRETFERAHARFQLNRKDAERNRLNFYLLSGLVRCGACGHPYHGRHVKHYDIRYYRCETNHSRHRFPDPCRNIGVRADTLEAMVWERVVELITQPEAVLLGQRMMAEQAAAEGTSGVEEQLFAIRRNLRKVEARKSRVLDVLLDRPQDKRILSAKLDELDRETERLQAQEKRLLDEQKNAASREQRLADVREAFETLRPRLANLAPADRHQVCRLLIEEVRIYRNKEVQVDWIIPTSGQLTKGAGAHSTSSFVLPRRTLRPDAVKALSIRNRTAMRRRVAAGLYVSPTRDPVIAKKVSEALLRRVRAGTWQRPPAPMKDAITGRWIKGKATPQLKS